MCHGQIFIYIYIIYIVYAQKFDDAIFGDGHNPIIPCSVRPCEGQKPKIFSQWIGFVGKLDTGKPIEKGGNHGNSGFNFL